MKVITIKQPWASLIAHNHKQYEFRSWKTNYRGEIYIHAGAGLDRKYLSRYEELHLNYPKFRIMAKANLVDCIELTPETEEKIRKERPLFYDFGKNRGGYAWVLKDIELVEFDEEIKGKLSIWNYK